MKCHCNGGRHHGLFPAWKCDSMILVRARKQFGLCFCHDKDSQASYSLPWEHCNQPTDKWCYQPWLRAVVHLCIFRTRISSSNTTMISLESSLAFAGIARLEDRKDGYKLGRLCTYKPVSKGLPCWLHSPSRTCTWFLLLLWSNTIIPLPSKLGPPRFWSLQKFHRSIYCWKASLQTFLSRHWALGRPALPYVGR